MSICSKCSADSNHADDAGVCPSEFASGSWIDRVGEGDRFKLTRPVPRSWLERPPTKTAIVIELDHLRDLMREFTIEQEPDEDARVGLDWTFELFLQWTRRKVKEERDDTTTNS